MDRSKWEYKKLGEVCEVLDKFRKPVTKSDRVAGQYPYYGATGIQDYVADYIFDGRYLLLGEDGAKWGANENSAFIIEGKSWVNNHAHILKIDDSFMDIFVMYYLNHKDLSEYITGAVVPKLTQAAMLKIPVPNISIADQQRIVAELDCLNEMIALKQGQLKEFDKLAQSIFYDMFGDPATNEKGWELREMESLCTHIVDCPHSTPKKVDVITPYPCIRTSELKGGEVQWDTMQYLDEQEYEIRVKRLRPLPGDIVFGREGTIGDAVILPRGYNFSLGQRTMLLRVDKSVISEIFLHRTILSEWVRRQIKMVNVSSTVAHVNIKDFKVFDIPLPPLALQQQFAEKIQAIEAQKELVKKSIAETQQLLDSRMDYYFD